MKKIVLVAFAMAIASPMAAVEHPLNPDRFPSIGLSYEGFGSEGELEVRGTAFKQDVEESTAFLILDSRLPLSNSFTLDIAFGLVGARSELKETPALFGQETTQGGGYFRLGARYYFNRGARSAKDSGF